MDVLAEQIKTAREGERFDAENEQRRANAAWLRRRPDIEATKAQASAAQRERTAVMANLRTLKGQQLDPSNPRHAAFLSRAETAGIFIDSDEWNSSASNLVSVIEVDPENPTQTRQKFYNKATGELSDVGQKGYVQPVKASGMTESQERTDADRDAGRADTNTRFGKTFNLNLEKFEEQQRRGMSADAQKLFNVQTKGSFEQLRAIHKRIEEYQTRAAKAEMRPETARERISALQSEALSLSEEIEAARGNAINGMTPAGIRPRANRAAPPAAGGGAYSGKRFSRSKLEGMRGAFGGKPVEAIEKIITQNGGTIY